MRVLRLIVLFCLAMGPVSGPGIRAQNGGEFHEFTDKRGQKVKAKLVGISEDRRMMNIVREDGRAFDTVINQLSLDDQQFVKDWLKARPGGESATGATAFRVDVTVTRTVGESRKHSNDTYAMEEKDNLFRVTVKNLSRDPISSARVEYAVIWNNAVSVYEDKDDAEWSFRSHGDDGVPPRAKVLGSAAIENLRFNGEFTFETTPVSMDRVLYDGNELYREDELLGLKVRVMSSSGTLILDTHSGSAAVGSITWDQIPALEDPPVIE